jgi:hypothetical protein
VDKNPQDLSHSDVLVSLQRAKDTNRKEVAQRIAQALFEKGSSEIINKVQVADSAIGSELKAEVEAAKNRQGLIGTWIECTGRDAANLSKMGVTPKVVAELKRVAELGYSLKLEGNELLAVGPLDSMSISIELTDKGEVAQALERNLKSIKDIKISDGASEILNRDNRVAIGPDGVIKFERDFRAEGFQGSNYIYDLSLFGDEKQSGANTPRTKKVEITEKRGALVLDVALDNDTHQIYKIDLRQNLVTNDSAPKLEVSLDIERALKKEGIVISDNRLMLPEGYQYYRDAKALSLKDGYEAGAIDPFSKEDDNGAERAPVTSAVVTAEENGRFALNVKKNDGEIEIYIIDTEMGYILKK